MYFLALIPEPSFSDKVRNLQRELREKFGLSYAMRLPPHITLQAPFNCQIPERELEGIISHIRDKFRSIKLKASGFDSFINAVVYISMEPNDELLEFQSWLSDYLNSTGCLSLSQGNNDYVPHITLAHRDLDTEHFEEVWKDFESRKIDDEFYVNELVIFRHDQRSWHVEKSIRSKALFA